MEQKLGWWRRIILKGGIVKNRKLLTLLGSICLVLVLVALLLPACAKEEAPVTPTPVAAKPIVWKFANYSKMWGGFNEAAYWYFDEIERRTGGRLKVEFYVNESLVPKKEQPEALKSGMCQATVFEPAYYMAKIPYGLGISYPFVNVASHTRQGFVDSYALANMWWRHPNLTKQLDKWDAKLLSPIGCTQVQMIGNVPVRTTKDLKGLKIRVLGPNTEVLEYFGAVPIFIGIADSYSALQTGMIDLFAHDFYLFPMFNLFEVSKYAIDDMTMGTNMLAFVVKDSAFKTLPEDIQKVMLEVGEGRVEWLGDYYYKIAARARAQAEELLDEVIQFPPEERLKMVEAAKKTAWESYFKTTEEMGLTEAREMFDWIIGEAEKMGY